MPQMPTFRDITRTQGVDQYALNYHDYCHGDGSATQVTADGIEALGIDPRSDNPLLPNAAILRGAEAVDAILNAADSGSSDVPNSMNAGRILCSSATPMRLIEPLRLCLRLPCLRCRRWYRRIVPLIAMVCIPRLLPTSPRTPLPSRRIAFEG